MRDSPSKGERTSEAILEAAYALFLEQGYHGTSMRQIAQRAGLALGGIYNHFDSKEQIFETILIEKHPYRKVLDILLATSGESLEIFAENAARTMSAELGKRPDFLKLFFIELSEFKAKHVTILVQTIFPKIYPLLQRFKEQQDELRDLPQHVILLSFLGTFFAYFMVINFVVPTNVFDPSGDELEHFIDIFLHGVLKPHQGKPIIPNHSPETYRAERQ
jgi:AcrR family transcriptional regulator